MNNIAIRLLMLTLILSVGTVSGFASPRTAFYAHPSNSLIREAIIRELGNPDEWGGNAKDIKFVSRRADLNNDGRSELLVWVPTIGYGGTSGYPLLIFRREGQRLGLMSKLEQVWTPFVILRTTRHGWHDIVMQMGGGGLPMEYVVFRHDGSVYPNSPESVEAKRIRGRWLNEFFPQQAAAYQRQSQQRFRSKLRGTNPVEIRKDWKMSVMGPLPQQ